jgi:hypothetical protein
VTDFLHPCPERAGGCPGLPSRADAVREAREEGEHDPRERAAREQPRRDRDAVRLRERYDLVHPQEAEPHENEQPEGARKESEPERVLDEGRDAPPARARHVQVGP